MTYWPEQNYRLKHQMEYVGCAAWIVTYQVNKLSYPVFEQTGAMTRAFETEADGNLMEPLH